MIKINATPKAAVQVEQLSLALGVKKEEITDMAVSLLWKLKANEVKEFLGSIDDSSALFNGVETDSETELVETSKE